MARKLIFKERHYHQLRKHLLQDKNEHACILLLGVSKNKDNILFPVHSIIIPPGYQKNTRTYFQLDCVDVLKSLNKFKNTPVLGYMMAHSHPFAANATFSSLDDRSFEENAEDILLRKKKAYPLRLVYGTSETGFTIEYYDSREKKLCPVEEIVVVSDAGIKKIPRFNHKGKTEFQNLDKWTRNIEWFGVENQKTIAETTLGICGVGGIGNPTTIVAMHYGFQNFILVDHDIIEESNFNRLLNANSKTLGKYKVDLLYHHIKRFNPKAKIRRIRKKIQDEKVKKLLLDADILICGFDNDQARLQLLVYAAKHLKPLIEMGTGIFLSKDKSKVVEKGSHIRFYIPGGPCLLCMGLDTRNIISETQKENRARVGYVDDSNESPGSVITLNTVIASIAIDITARYLTGEKVPINLIYDELNHRILNIQNEKNPNCPICGANGIEGLGEEEKKRIRAKLPKKEFRHAT